MLRDSSLRLVVNSAVQQQTVAMERGAGMDRHAAVAGAATDEELMQAVAGGDAEALAALMQRHMSRVRAIGWRMLGTADAADDLAQEVFLRIWRSPQKFDPARGPFVHWLARVAANAALDRLRRCREVSLDDESGQALAAVLHDPAPDPETQSMQAEHLQKLRAAVAALPERQRLAITLAHDLGHGNMEIARIMGISVEAVESLLGRARRTLKNQLREVLLHGTERDRNS